jgi:hypothetical protein
MSVTTVDRLIGVASITRSTHVHQPVVDDLRECDHGASGEVLTPGMSPKWAQ